MRYEGASALPGSRPATRGHLVVTPTGHFTSSIDFWETRGGKTVREYDVEMTQRIHLIVISRGVPKESVTFEHLHPRLGIDGHFRLSVTPPVPGTYEVYADTVPHGDAQTVFRFEARLGPRSAFGTPTPKVETGRAGPYRVSLDKTTVEAGRETPIVAEVTRQGRPATDLTSYLGAVAHIVLIDDRTLDYVHVHPDVPGAKPGAAMDMSMPGMAMDERELAPGTRVPSKMTFRIRVATPGTYSMWLQFRGGNALEVAPFSINAR